MSLASKKVKAYVQGVAIATVLVAVVVVLFMNRNHSVKFWFFGLTDATKDVNVVWLVLSIAGTTRILWWVVTFAFGLWRDLGEIKRLTALEQAEKAHAARVTELEQRERRLDENLKQSGAAGSLLTEPKPKPVEPNAPTKGEVQ